MLKWYLFFNSVSQHLFLIFIIEIFRVIEELTEYVGCQFSKHFVDFYAHYGKNAWCDFISRFSVFKKNNNKKKNDTRLFYYKRPNKHSFMKFDTGYIQPILQVESKIQNDIFIVRFMRNIFKDNQKTAHFSCLKGAYWPPNQKFENLLWQGYYPNSRYPTC